jgi:hypothetical protein
LVRELGLKEGDQISRDTLALRKVTRDEALRRIQAARWEFPADYKFDREEANER